MVESHDRMSILTAKRIPQDKFLNYGPHNNFQTPTVAQLHRLMASNQWRSIKA